MAAGKIGCIKRMREAFGLGLLEAKQVVDGTHKLSDVMDVNCFNDNGVQMVNTDRLRALLAAEYNQQTITPRRVPQADLDAYFYARLAREKAQRAFDRATDRLNAAENATESTVRIIRGE